MLQRGWWPQPKRGSLRPPCLSSFNTEHTEALSDLCVEALLTTEHTETLRTAGKIFAAREEDENYWYRSLRAVASHELVHGIDQRVQAALSVDPSFREFAEAFVGLGTEFAEA